MKKYWPSLCAAILLGPIGASAQEFDYNIVQGGLVLYPSFGNQTLVGVDVQGMYSLTPEVFLLGGLTYATDDIDLTAMHLGGAYRFPVAATTDLYGGLTLEYQRSSTSFGGMTFSVDDTAIGLRGGVRHQLNPTLEIGGQVRVITGDLDYVGLRGSASYLLNPQLSLLGELDLYDGEFGLIGGVRFRF